MKLSTKEDDLKEKYPDRIYMALDANLGEDDDKIATLLEDMLQESCVGINYREKVV